MEKSNGQQLIDRLAAWFQAYLYLPNADVALVLALWAVGSWTFDHFFTWPYLAVTASVKGAGKSRTLKLLRLVCRGSFLGVGPSPAFVLRKILATNGHFTLLWDEAEAASSDRKSFLSEVLNSGYQRGDTIGKARGPIETIEYPAYCPKAFALIGDTTGTVRDRSIVLTMERGNPPTEFLPEVVTGQGEALTVAIQDVLGASDIVPSALPPAWLDTRDREIWGAMFGLAVWLKLDKATMDHLTRFAADNVAGKTAPARRNTSYEDEDAVVDARYGERAMNDLLSVLREGEKAIFSAVAVKRMRELPMGPWRTFRGEGLNPVMLAGLVSRFGCQSRVVRMEAGRKGKQLNGYSAADIRASVPKGGL